VNNARTCVPWGEDHSVEAWAERHRRVGHNPRPAPTRENPERWDCDDCNHIWRILTPEHVRQKFVHLRTPKHLTNPNHYEASRVAPDRLLRRWHPATRSDGLGLRGTHEHRTWLDR
jgi:hypothetical protein